MNKRLSFYHPNLNETHISALKNILKKESFLIRNTAVDFFNCSEEPNESLKQYCETEKIEYAQLAHDQRFSEFSMLVSDMDSTLITIECIDELADFANIKPKIAEITERSMRGELDFAQSLTARVALLKGLNVNALERVYETRLKLTAGAEALLAACAAHSVKFVLVSGGFTYFTERLKTRLNLHFAAANELEIEDNVLTGRVLGDILDAQAKEKHLKNQSTKLNIPLKRTIAMGDGANDLPMIEAAGLGVAFHAKPVVEARADLAIRFHGLESLPALLGE